MITRRMRIRLLPVAALAVALLCALAAKGQDKPSGAKTVVVPRTHIQVDEKSGTVTVTETPQVSQPPAPVIYVAPAGGSYGAGPAAGSEEQARSLLPGLEPAPETAPRFRITGADCRRLVTQWSQVGADYLPGRDARGTPVTPAAGGAVPPLPAELVIPLTKDPKFLVGRTAAALRYDVALGRVALGGVKLPGPLEQEAAERCRRALAGQVP